MDENRISSIRGLVEHFSHTDVPVTQGLLEEYCQLNGMDIVSVGDYSDWKYQLEYEGRFALAFPRILEELTKLALKSPLASKTKQGELEERNNEVEVAIARVLIDCDVRFHTSGMSEVELILRHVNTAISGALEGAKNRATTSAGEAIDRIALERLGSPLTLRSIINYLENSVDEAKEPAVEPPTEPEA